ncbi:helix-turn-helix domain-containing protein [Atlantibacter sp. RC6]|uniref:helix-turn-helix domain-containing protein n=1 Tax=Atlantibacter sp. RC6 TaxID=2587036 RepID=UPI00160567BF|nr:helix-turn-helix domain-containing protein [Atlantibacter sp. RC6]MBB3320758.1 hypothetical protein [Atlantibacter sp. RC6]
MQRETDSYEFPNSSGTFSHPGQELNELIGKLIPYGEPVQLAKSQRIYLKQKEENACYLLVDGYYSLRYQNDGTIISNIYPPIIAGLAEIFANHNPGYFRAEVAAQAIRVSEKAFFKCLSEHPEQWLTIAKIQSYTILRLLLRDRQINTKNAYLTICHLLNDLNNQPAMIREHTIAAHYILDRTHLARSTIMSILAKLQRGNHIVIKKGGYLVEINHLPEQLFNN